MGPVVINPTHRPTLNPTNTFPPHKNFNPTQKNPVHIYSWHRLLIQISVIFFINQSLLFHLFFFRSTNPLRQNLIRILYIHIPPVGQHSNQRFVVIVVTSKGSSIRIRAFFACFLPMSSRKRRLGMQASCSNFIPYFLDYLVWNIYNKS